MRGKTLIAALLLIVISMTALGALSLKVGLGAIPLIPTTGLFKTI